MTPTQRSRAGVLAAAVTSAALLVSALPMGAAAQEDWQGVDDGTTITMWSRAATEDRVRQIVDAYNAGHQNQIELTIVPTDDYQARVGTAAGSGTLPDLFSADVVFMPNWTSQGLFTDITDRIASLPYLDNVAPAHIDASTWDGKQYGLPFIIDLSVWMYNKELFRQAGLDPEKPPTTLAEFDAAARAVDALGGDVHGTYFGGSCGGCNVFTWWPIAWADGEAVMNPEGTEALLNSEEMKTIYSTFRKLHEDGITGPGTQEEQGPTWTQFFPQGVIGIMPMPATLTGYPADGIANEDIGVTPIAGINGGESTFVGGDSIGLSRDSQNQDAAWNFLAWLLDEEAQVEVIAKNGNVVARSDLADNQYSSADPRLVLFNTIAGKGQTPFALNFGSAFNAPQSPWVQLLFDALFGDASLIDQDNEAITAELQR